MVVAAINRLDGRKYAVKRIPLDAQSPASYARIIREVSTLSRLQHPHVVRYFQVSSPEERLRLFFRHSALQQLQGLCWHLLPAIHSPPGFCLVLLFSHHCTLPGKYQQACAVEIWLTVRRHLGSIA